MNVNFRSVKSFFFPLFWIQLLLALNITIIKRRLGRSTRWLKLIDYERSVTQASFGRANPVKSMPLNWNQQLNNKTSACCRQYLNASFHWNWLCTKPPLVNGCEWATRKAEVRYFDFPGSWDCGRMRVLRQTPFGFLLSLLKQLNDLIFIIKTTIIIIIITIIIIFM